MTGRRLGTPITGHSGASAVRGVKWTSSSAAVVFAVQLAQTAVLAHLLSPRDFGLMAAMVVVMGLAQAFADVGLSNAVVVREASREQLSSLYWANVGAGALVSLAVLASTPLVVALYDEPDLHGLLPWASIVFFVGSFGQQFAALLERQLRFEVLARVDVASAAAGMCVAVTAASAGAGALALVLGLIASATTRAAMLVARGWSAWRPAARLRRADLQGFMGFGAYQMGDRALGFLTANVDYVLVGRFLGAHELGVYALAYQLVVRPVALLTPVLNRVAIPIFARHRHDPAALRRGFSEMTRLLAFVTLPALAMVAVAAPLVVPLLLGPGWDASVPVVQVLAALAAMRALGTPIGAVFIGKDRPDLGFKMTAVMLPVLAVTLWLVVERGVVAVAWAYVVVQAASIVVFLPVVKRVLDLGVARYLSLLGAPVALTAATVLATLATQAALPPTAGGPVSLLTIATVGGGCYCALMAALRRTYVTWLWSLLRRPAPQGPGAASAPRASAV